MPRMTTTRTIRKIDTRNVAEDEGNSRGEDETVWVVVTVVVGAAGHLPNGILSVFHVKFVRGGNQLGQVVRPVRCLAGVKASIITLSFSPAGVAFLMALAKFV